MECMMVVTDANTGETSHKRCCLCCWTHFFFFFLFSADIEWVFHDWAQDNGGRPHSGREGLVLFVQDNNNNNNILRCYGVPLTVQMEESVKFPGDINAFPTLTQRETCVR